MTNEWNGKDRPEIGQAVSYFYAEGEEWRTGTCVAHYRSQVVVCDVQDDGVARVSTSQLRPLSPSGEWVDELIRNEKVINMRFRSKIADILTELSLAEGDMKHVKVYLGRIDAHCQNALDMAGV